METHDVPRELRELCFSADWACADGNLETLRLVAAQLAFGSPEPFHSWLLALAAMCREDPDEAIGMWLLIKERISPRLQRLPS